MYKMNVNIQNKGIFEMSQKFKMFKMIIKWPNQTEYIFYEKKTEYYGFIIIGRFGVEFIVLIIIFYFF